MNSRTEIYHICVRTGVSFSHHLFSFVPQMVRYKFYLPPILLIASWIYVSHRKYAKSCATSHAKACENSMCVSSWPRGSRESLKYLDVLFVQRIETVFLANGISLEVSVTSNAVIVPLWQEFVAWRMIQNRKYLPHVKCTPGSRWWRKSSSNLPDYFFYKQMCYLSKCCLHSRHEFSGIYAVTRTKTIIRNLKPVEN